MLVSFFLFFSPNERGSVWYNFGRKLFFAVLRDAKIKVSRALEGRGGIFRGGKEESIGKMEFHRWIPRRWNEGEKVAGIFDRQDSREFHFSDVLRTFALRVYRLTDLKRLLRVIREEPPSIRFRGISSLAQPPFYVTIIAPVNSAVPQLFAFLPPPSLCVQTRSTVSCVPSGCKFNKLGRETEKIPLPTKISRRISRDIKRFRRNVDTLERASNI